MAMCTLRYSSNHVEHYCVLQRLVWDHQTVALGRSFHLFFVIGLFSFFVFLHLIKRGMDSVVQRLLVKMSRSPDPTVK